MKKSLLALLVSSVLVLSACEDKELTQKLAQAEQNLTQLKADLDKSNQALNEAKSALEKAAQTFPALNVEIYPLFEQQENIKFEKDPQDEFVREETWVELFASTASTQIEWLDNLLLKAVERTFVEKNSDNLTKESLTNYLKTVFQDMKKEAIDSKPIRLYAASEMFYVGQRGKLVIFSLYNHSYTGGAHGIFNTDYLVFDVTKKAELSVDDLFSADNKAKLKEALWRVYVDEFSNNPGQEPVQPYIDKEDFFINDNFYFSDDGIHFVYPPYALGPYMIGEVELMLDWFSLNPLLNADYQLTKKDGFGLSNINME